MLWYIITSVVMAIVILVLIKVFGYKFPTKKEREKAAGEKKRKESEQLIKFMNEHPDKEKINKEFFNQPHIKDTMKKIFDKDEQNNK